MSFSIYRVRDIFIINLELNINLPLFYLLYLFDLILKMFPPPNGANGAIGEGIISDPLLNYASTILTLSSIVLIVL